MTVTIWLRDAAERAEFEKFLVWQTAKHEAEWAAIRAKDASDNAARDSARIEAAKAKVAPEVPAYASTDEPPGRDIEPERTSATIDEGSGQGWTKAATLEEARAALHELVARAGLPVGRALLSEKFGVQKVSDIPADKLGEFVAQSKVAT